ncbi:putative Zn-dependent peptidase [Haloactinopolyspora alba]|uniref:Putative Zn-dependent peptidase n=1 Tax=Haloactinopolyspora alba TaxID=648780 RepID=A0A2P8DV64_9ACTN|nr:pitrilysin family protein [Haloactinopolyspora alba]PSL01123.1 putative Zn-dependent peptidase [Haloactinopolyspora alba]
MTGFTRTLLGEDEGGLVRRTVLPSGLRIVTEAVPTVRSVSIGMWAGVGSVDEAPHQAGATHYLEHLLFKGTPKRSVLDISAAIESVGGELNAFTAKEFTCYFARVLDTDLPLAVDVVADMVTSSLIESADVESERDVVLEEISMRDDDPSDAVHDLVAERMWGDSPLGRSILGTVDSITSMSRDTVHDYYRGHYLPRNIVVAAAGNVSHDDVVAMVTDAFATAGFDVEESPAPPRIGGTTPVNPPGVSVLHRPTEQANVVLAVPGLARNDDRRFALGVLNAAIGGGMSSRLFQEIRERRGLAYAVYSYAAQHAAAGMFGVYVGCQPKKVDEVLELCRSTLDEVVSSGISKEELDRGKGQARGGLVLGLEDTSARMSRLAKAELVYDELPSVDELISRVDGVTMDQVRELAETLLTASPSLAVVGPFDEARRFDAAVA